MPVKLLIYQCLYLSPPVIACRLQDRSFAVESCEKIAAADGDKKMLADEVLGNSGVDFLVQFIETDLCSRRDGDAALSACNRVHIVSVGFRNAIDLVPDLYDRFFFEIEST